MTTDQTPCGVACADVSAWAARAEDGSYGTVAAGDLVGAAWLVHRADVELRGAAGFLPGGAFADGDPEDLVAVAEQILSARQELAALSALLLDAAGVAGGTVGDDGFVS